MTRKYAIVDLETTGGQFRRDRIIEIGIVLTDGYTILDQFQSLVNPGFSIPPYITKLTGITTEMVSDAPRFYEVAKRVVEMTADAIFVAHNVRFDYSFIKRAYENLGYTYTRKQLCTARLAKVLRPDLRKVNLDALIREYGIDIEKRHRALDDAKATYEILTSMLEMDGTVQAIDDLINCGIKASKLPLAIDLDDLHDLPEACGVYYFHNHNGDVVYVGKSINIKKRVMQHFAKFTAKASKLSQQVADISFELTGSELVALLLESHEIKRLNPQINKSQRRKLFPFAIYYFYNEHGYLELRAEKITKRTPEEYHLVKEYPKLVYARNHLKALVQSFGLCSHLCGDKTGNDFCFNYQIGQCLGACHHMEEPDEYNQRVEEALTFMKRDVTDNFYLIDEGRNSDEKSIVKVEGGEFCGFGYVNQGTVIENHSELDTHITYYPNHRDAQRLIHWYVRENKMKDVIYFQ